MLTALLIFLGLVALLASCATSQDLFMQWYPIGVALDGTDIQTLVSTEVTTGLSIRGKYAWLIHRVEFYMETLGQSDATCQLDMTLSTVRGLAARPVITDKGTICSIGNVTNFTTSGFHRQFLPWVWTSLPPTIIAAPILTLYAEGSADVVAYRGDAIVGRIGYTTVPIDDKTYLEIAETFETL